MKTFCPSCFSVNPYETLSEGNLVCGPCLAKNGTANVIQKVYKVPVVPQAIQVKIKKLHPNAVIPKYAKYGDAGLDLVAVSDNYLDFYDGRTEYIEYHTGLAIEIPEGYVGLIYPRSSISNKSLTLANSVGVIDSGYRGEICVRFKSLSSPRPHLHPYQTWDLDHYQMGDKVAQLIIMPYPKVELEEVDELSETSRGDGGFGSSGK